MVYDRYGLSIDPFEATFSRLLFICRLLADESSRILSKISHQTRRRNRWRWHVAQWTFFTGPQSICEWEDSLCYTHLLYLQYSPLAPSSCCLCHLFPPVFTWLEQDPCYPTDIWLGQCDPLLFQSNPTDFTKLQEPECGRIEFDDVYF